MELKPLLLLVLLATLLATSVLARRIKPQLFAEDAEDDIEEEMADEIQEALADAFNCGCSWANAAACANPDGSVCHKVCCGNVAPAQPVYHPPANTGGCNCGWANAAACANSDGSHCHQVCCGSSKPQPQPQPQPQSGGWQGMAKTTRYWDCCKPSCAWPSNVHGAQGVVRSCLKDGRSTANPNVPNICGGGGAPGGPAYMCNDHQPFTHNGVLYAFAASNVDCCTCYELEFTDTAVAGKRMIVQVTNKGGDLGSNHFDLQMPGGGLGIFDGCTPQFNHWNGGQRYGGLTNDGQCSGLPQALQDGCHWRFRDFKNADNPNARFKRIACPAVLTNKSGCSK